MESRGDDATTYSTFNPSIEGVETTSLPPAIRQPIALFVLTLNDSADHYFID